MNLIRTVAIFLDLTLGKCRTIKYEGSGKWQYGQVGVCYSVDCKCSTKMEQVVILLSILQCNASYMLPPLEQNYVKNSKILIRFDRLSIRAFEAPAIPYGIWDGLAWWGEERFFPVFENKCHKSRQTTVAQLSASTD